MTDVVEAIESTVEASRPAGAPARPVKTQFRLGELFSGPGGIAKGAAMASIEDPSYQITHQWATDYDEDTCQTYAHNITRGSRDSVLRADVRTLDFELLRERGEIDGLAFGFPCNDFSVVGESKGFGGTFGPLYTYGVKALEMFQPDWFLAENVGGLQTNAGGAAIKQIFADMRAAGYRLYPHLYKFDQYGVPQARRRVIIIGIRNDLGVEYRVPSTAPYSGINNSAKKALTDPPIPPDAKNNELTKQGGSVVERLKHIKPGQNAFTAKLPPELELNVKGARISQIYRRLHPDKPSYTVTGSGGGGTHVYHWEEDRALTNRERARLQTFPDDYVFMGRKESVRKQIGMAVPVEGARIIFEAVLRSFAGIDYPSEKPSIDA